MEIFAAGWSPEKALEALVKGILTFQDFREWYSEVTEGLSISDADIAFIIADADFILKNTK
jgi:hypothetical protein